VLEYVPGHFEVIRLARPELSRTACEHMVQESAPSPPIDRSWLVRSAGTRDRIEVFCPLCWQS
jgi:transposase